MTLEEIRRIVEQASPGPWEIFDNGFDGGICSPMGPMICGGEPNEGRMEPKDPDTVFIAASRDLVPRMLKVIEAGKALADAGHFQRLHHPALFAAKQAFEEALSALEQP